MPLHDPINPKQYILIANDLVMPLKSINFLLFSDFYHSCLLFDTYDEICYCSWLNNDSNERHAGQLSLSQ